MHFLEIILSKLLKALRERLLLSHAQSHSKPGFFLALGQKVAHYV